MSLRSVNPATGKLIEEWPEMSAGEVDEALKAATQCQQTWRRHPFAERAALLHTAGSLLRREVDPLAERITAEMGKPIAQSRAEVEKCAWVCDYYSHNAESFLTPEPVEGPGDRAAVFFEPLGAILAIMPWNFPFWQVFRAAAPALMAGNVVLLKHASNTTGCALDMEAIFRKAGFPKGAFQVLRLGSDKIAPVIANPTVAGVTLTGSTEAGRKVAAAAGAALKKVVLELGGSDPYVVLEDANLERSAEILAAGRFQNCGQSCIAAKRFVVVESVREQFEKFLLAEMEKWTAGDPTDPEVKLGPMASVRLRAELHEQVERAVNAGARLVRGGKIPEGDGAFYPATLLTNVDENNPAAREELFGPVAIIQSAADEAEALRLANATDFGLGGGVFTQDLDRGWNLAATEISAGTTAVNGAVASDPRIPFGGVRQSGFGRELGIYGIREFVNVKSVVLHEL